MKSIGAGRGRRSPKSGQSNHFVGYKKHTISGLIRARGQWRPVPIFSLARPAGKADVEMLKPLLNHVRRRLGDIWPMHLVMGDKGYISAHRAQFLRQRWGVALVVSPKADMRPPANTDPSGCPLCPVGEKLVWEDYDPQDEMLLYSGSAAACQACPLSGRCTKRFEFAAAAHETFWGMVPHHSHLARELMRWFRPRTEPGFNTAKNRHRLKEFFINSRTLAQTLCTMSDIAEILKIMAQEAPQEALRAPKEQLREIKQLELWE